MEQATKNWEGEKFQAQSSARNFFAAAPLFQFAPPPLIGAHPLLPSSRGHVCCDLNESESYRSTIICRHCVDQQTDLSVFAEFQSDHTEWSHWKVGGQRPSLAPLHRNLEGHSPSLPYSLFHPWLCTTPSGLDSEVRPQSRPWTLWVVTSGFVNIPRSLQSIFKNRFDFCEHDDNFK